MKFVNSFLIDAHLRYDHTINMLNTTFQVQMESHQTCKTAWEQCPAFGTRVEQ